MALKKFIKVRDLADNGEWRDILCELADEHAFLYEVMDSHKNISKSVGYLKPKDLPAAVTEKGEAREVTWQADKLPE